MRLFGWRESWGGFGATLWIEGKEEERFVEGVGANQEVNSCWKVILMGLRG